jgi:hypothetical protein
MYIGTTLLRLAERRLTVPFKCFVPSDRAVMVFFVLTVVSRIALNVACITPALSDIIKFDAAVAVETRKPPFNLLVFRQSSWHPTEQLW